MPAPHTVPPERRRKIKEGRLPIPLTAAFAFVLKTGVFQTIRSSAPLLMHSYVIYIRLVACISRQVLINFLLSFITPTFPDLLQGKAMLPKAKLASLQQ